MWVMQVLTGSNKIDKNIKDFGLEEFENQFSSIIIKKKVFLRHKTKVKKSQHVK